MDLQFQEGDFQKLRVTGNGLHLGQFSLSIPAGATVEFDGLTLKYGGQSFAAPNVVGACRVGWLVPVADQKSTFKAQSAGVQVRPATSAGQERGASMTVVAIAEDEQVVGSLDASAARRETARTANMTAPMSPTPQEAAPPPAPPKDRPAPRLPPPRSVEPAPTVTEAPAEPEFQSEVVHVEGQEGRTVGRIGTPLKFTPKFEDARSADEAIRILESSKPARLQKTASQRPEPLPPSKINAEAEAGVPITKNLPNGATGDVAAARTGDTLEELLPDAASSGTPVVVKDAAFTWDKSGHWRDRVKRAMDQHGDDPTTINKICAVEIKMVSEYIQKEMARRSR